MWIHWTDGRPFAQAGIYNGEPKQAASVITCAPNSLMAPIHHRMPVVLDSGYHDAWLDPESDAVVLQVLLLPREWPELAAQQVSTR